MVRKGANSRIYDQSGLVRDAAIQGTIGVGTTIDFYGYTAQLKNPEFCKYVLPADGTIVNAGNCSTKAAGSNVTTPSMAYAALAVPSADLSSGWAVGSYGSKPVLALSRSVACASPDLSSLAAKMNSFTCAADLP